MIEPTQKEVMELFPDYYEGYKSDFDTVANMGYGEAMEHLGIEPEIDDDLGLEIVQKETIESKYGVPKLNPSNDFHNSLKEQFEHRGHLSPKQVACLRNPRY